MNYLRWPALALALVSSAASAGHFTFQDWEVACDNTRRCEAVGYQAEEAPAPVALLLARAAGATAPVTARLTPYLDDDSTIGPLTVQVGPTTVRGLRADVELQPEQVARLLPLLLNAAAATVSDGKHTWTLSLAGMKAALLKLDDVQGRVGTATALAMPGARPAAAVRAPLPPPEVRPLPAVATRKGDEKLLPLIVKTLKHGGCDSPVDLVGGERYNELHRLSATQVLLVLECGRGAYQSSFELWTASDRPPYAAKPVKLPDPTGANDGYLLNPSFEDGQLSSYAKGRGLGDCNSQAAWSWTASGFKLVEASSGQLCRGFPGGVPLRDYTATVLKPVK